jgi:hypothetical protein
VLIAKRDRGVPPHERQGELLAGGGARDGREGIPDLLKARENSSRMSFPQLHGSRVSFSGSRRGVGSNNVASSSIGNMITNEISRVFRSIYMPKGSVCLDLDIGRPVDIVGISLKIAPQGIPFPIS